MTSSLSISRWIGDLRDGNADAVRKIWEAYFPRMVALARQRLHGHRRAADEEDVALSAFKSFWGGARAGRFPDLADRIALWPLLMAITGHKCVDLVRRETRRKRGGTCPAPSADPEDVNQVPGREPAPELSVEAAEEADRLLDLLDRTGDATLRLIAQWKLAGESTTAVADRLGCVRRTVERKLQLVASLWERELSDARTSGNSPRRPVACVADAPAKRGM